MLRQQSKIGQIEFRCPHTDRPIETGVGADVRSLARVWYKDMQVRCPHCGLDHDFSFRGAYLEQVLRV
jgi:hypothetical protein